MKRTRLSPVLRALAALILIASLGSWLATGRHLGWTQTSVVSIQHDEITGIDYPVRQPGFIAGVEVLVIAAAAAATLAGLSLVHRKPAR